MKTTIELPDELASAAKELARDRGLSLRELVVSGLRAELDRRREAPSVDFHFPTFSGAGLSTDLEPSEMIAHSYELPS